MEILFFYSETDETFVLKLINWLYFYHTCSDHKIDALHNNVAMFCIDAHEFVVIAPIYAFYCLCYWSREGNFILQVDRWLENMIQQLDWLWLFHCPSTLCLKVSWSDEHSSWCSSDILYVDCLLSLFANTSFSLCSLQHDCLMRTFKGLHEIKCSLFLLMTSPRYEMPNASILRFWCKYV